MGSDLRHRVPGRTPVHNLAGTLHKDTPWDDRQKTPIRRSGTGLRTLFPVQGQAGKRCRKPRRDGYGLRLQTRFKWSYRGPLKDHDNRIRCTVRRAIFFSKLLPQTRLRPRQQDGRRRVVRQGNLPREPVTDPGRRPWSMGRTPRGIRPGKPKGKPWRVPLRDAAAGTNLWKSEGATAKRPSINSKRNSENTGSEIIYGNYGNYGREIPRQK